MFETCCQIDWSRPLPKLLLLATLSCGSLLCGLALAILHVPAFYQQQLGVPRATLAAANKTLQQQVEQMSDDLTQSGRWEIQLSEDQINGWLGSQLLKRLPRALPPDVYDPKVALEPSAARVAAMYQKGNLSVVLSIEVDPSLTGRPNEIALRIRSAQIGSVPGLADRAKQSIHYAALRSRVRIRWQKLEGDWIAKFDFDKSVFDLKRDIQLREIELKDGALRLSGETLPPRLPPVFAPIFATSGL